MKTTILFSGSLLLSAFSFGQTSASAHTGVDATTAVSGDKVVSSSNQAAAATQSGLAAGGAEAKNVIYAQKGQVSSTTAAASEAAKTSVNSQITPITMASSSSDASAEKRNNISVNTSLKKQSGQAGNSTVRPSTSVHTTASSAHSVQVKPAPVQMHAQVHTVAAFGIK